jgi:hypothetical protein
MDVKVARYNLPATWRPKLEDNEADEYGVDPTAGQTWFTDKYENIKNVPTFILIKNSKPFYFTNGNDLNRVI